MTARDAGAIRPERLADVPALKAFVEVPALFPADLLDGMIANHLAGEAHDEISLADDPGGLIAIAHRAAERMTQGTWNSHLVAVHPARQPAGRGGPLIQEVERLVVARGAHQLLMETAGRPEFHFTRNFYPPRGVAPQAFVRDFFRRSEDKAVFRKILSEREHLPT